MSDSEPLGAAPRPVDGLDAPTIPLHPAAWQRGGESMPTDPMGAETAAGQDFAWVTGKRSARRQGRQSQTPRMRRTAWFALGALVVVLLALAGSLAFGIERFSAPGDVATRYCANLRARDYAAAYALLAPGMRATYSQSQYIQLFTTLDTLEGAVQSCQVRNGGFQITLGTETAQVTLALTRARAGARQGALTLASVDGSWRIRALDSALLGVNLGALHAALAYCQALRTQNYAAVYALLAPEARLNTTPTAFSQLEQLQDQVDGKVTSCALTGLGQPESATPSTLNAGITRATLGQRQGALTLATTQSMWRLVSIETSLRGTDLSAFAIAARFCADTTSGNFADAYSLLSANGRAGQTEAEFASTMAQPAPGISFVSMRAVTSTYRAVDTVATVDISVVFHFADTGGTGSIVATLRLVRVGATWQVDGLVDPSA